MDVMNRLRAETREQHQRLHQIVDVEGSLRSRENYAALLAGFYRAVSPVELSIAAAIDQMGVPSPREGDWQDRLQKTCWLERDLQVLGAWEPSLRKVPDAASERNNASFERLLGQSYVVEGMTLGATRIAAQIRERLGLDGQTGGRFYHGYGDQTQRRWEAFRQWASQCPLEQPQDAIAAACETFDHFAKCLQASAARHA